jgi:putative transposase
MSKTKGSSTGAALDIFRLLKRHFDKGVSVRALAEEAGISERTIYRAIRAFRKDGISGLQREPRADKGKRRGVSDEVKEAIEGLCLRQPKPPVAWVHRHVAEACQQKGLPAPGYWVVLDIYRKLALLQRLAEKFETSYDTCFSVRFSDYAASNSSMSDFQNSP